MAHDDFRPEDEGAALSHLVEETGEVLAAFAAVLQASGKTLRFGLDSVNPLLPENQRETNKQWLERELDDLYSAVERFRAFAGLRPALKSPVNAFVNVEPAPDGSRTVVLYQAPDGTKRAFRYGQAGIYMELINGHLFYDRENDKLPLAPWVKKK